MPSDEEIERMRRETREAIARADALLASRDRQEPEAVEAVGRPAPRFEGRNARHRREIDAQERAFEIVRRTARLEQVRVAAHVEREAERSASDQRIAELEVKVHELSADLVRLMQHTADALNGIGDRVDELRDAPVKAADARMEALFARLDRRLDDIAPRRAADGEVIELPATFSPKRVN
jgi:hypothetical protein